MKKMIMAAKSENDVIGYNNDIPWNLPNDFEFLMKQIKNGYLLTGRLTFESTQGEDIFFQRDDVIVLSRDKDYVPKLGLAVQTIEEAFLLAEQLKVENLYILGGGEIYASTIDLVDELILTEVHIRCKGDTFFPKINTVIWEETRREHHSADTNNPYAYSFVWYKRKSMA